MRMRNRTADFVGSQGMVLGSMRINKNDFNILDELSSKLCWNNLAQTIRFMIKFTIANRQDFEKFVDKLRNDNILTS
jgi:hypothetical protein